MNNSKSNNFTLLPRLVGETRHYPPAVKEWSDSIYTYNKKYLKNLPSKDIMANKIIKSYFYLSDCKHLARSKRMRSLIRKSSANRLFVSTPELKQKSDNVAITIYTLDRERQILLRKIYHNIRKWENKRNVSGKFNIDMYNSYHIWRNKYILNSLSKLKNKGLVNTSSKQFNGKAATFKHLNRMHFFKTRSNLYILKKNHKGIYFKNTVLGKKNFLKLKNIPYFGAKSLNELKFLRYISQFKNNSIQARKRVYYYYMKRILSLLGIKVLSFDFLHSNTSNEKKTELLRNSNNLRHKGIILLFLAKKGEPLGKPEILFLNSIQENLPYLDKVNLVLSNFLNRIINNNNIITNKNFSFTNFSKVNFKEFLLKEYMQDLSHLGLKNNLSKTKLDFLKKEISLIKDYINIKINNFKFSKYLPALKLLISKIYNKNIELNIVKLKYLYLNSDIFTQAISMKLKKKINLLRVLRKSLKLVKLPSEFNDTTFSINNIRNLNVYNTLKIKNLFVSNSIKKDGSDNLDLVIKNLYPSSFINQTRSVKNNSVQIINSTSEDSDFVVKNKENTSKATNVINVIKYKWVTGVRLEAAGRLTRRYTASRSVYKYRYKGSLKNTDFSRKLDFLKKSMPVVMFRNNTKTNSQYTFAKSKKRIGAFGLKGWISSY